MSGALYDSLVEKWRDYLENHLWILDDTMQNEDVDDEYHELVSNFCKEHGYSERTENYFFNRWYDTFADMYFQELEKASVLKVPKRRRKNENPYIEW